MKIKQEIIDKGGLVKYKLDVGDGRYVISEMPVSVAAGIVAKEQDFEEKGEKPFNIKVGERRYFSKDIFEDEGQEQHAVEEAPGPNKEKRKG